MRLAPAGTNHQGGRLWSHAPRVDMGSRIRRDIEQLLRQHTIWNPYCVSFPEKSRAAVVEEFSSLGFRRSHVEEAVGECQDREEVLQWLLVYVPEEDLPRWSLPDNYSVGVSLASDDIARDTKIKRLASAGYPADLCGQVLDNQAGGDELAAAEYLQNALLHGAGFPNDLPSVAVAEDDHIWLEEQTILEATFGDSFLGLAPGACEVTSSVAGPSKPVSFRFLKPSKHYPLKPPVLLILANFIPAYIRLSAIRQAIHYAETSLLGEPMIYNILDWLETHLAGIIENPGKLRDISSLSASSPALVASTALAVRQAQRQRKPAPCKASSAARSQAIREAWELKQATKPQQNMTSKRQALPAWNAQEAIIETIQSHQVTIISGETGSGKSTQSVQFILDDMIKRNLGSVANIICTQPRRISAIGLADRVSDERCSAVGTEVGYIIRGDSRVQSGLTKITFVTTGVLLRRMQSGNGSIVDTLADISHIIVDEVHERSLDTDFLLALLRNVLRSRADLKVILMSATLDANVFIDYFAGQQSVGLVNIPGRTFPVDDYYLDDVLLQTKFEPTLEEQSSDEEEEEVEEDYVSENRPAQKSVGTALRSLGMGINYELIASTVRHIDSQLGDKPGGILIFLPGTLEIERCLASVKRMSNLHALPLHASLLPSEQRRVFGAAPRGKRKVVAATNVAETSITIEDIVAVIDTGRVKETSYDSKDNIVRLQEVWASQAACQQRRGRAGRVQAGLCYKLYTRNVEANMAARPEPEIRRVPLEQLCLSVKTMQGIDDVAAFLAGTITPPESMAVEGALSFLHRVGALDHDRLTALGRYLAMIPADLRCAKLMVYGTIFGCLDASVSIAAILTVKSPFVSPREKRNEAESARARFSSGDGDLLTDLRAYEQWNERVRAHGFWQTHSWCHANFLSHQILRDISSNRAQFLTALKDTGIIPADYRDDNDDAAATARWNRHSTNRALLRALIAGAFQPQIAQIRFPDKKFASSVSGTVEVDPDARTIKYFTQENGRVFVHPSSMLFCAQSYTGAAAYLSYFTKMATSKVFLRDLTRKHKRRSKLTFFEQCVDLTDWLAGWLD